MNRVFCVSRNHPIASVFQNRGFPLITSKRSATNPTLDTHQNRPPPGVKRMDGCYVRAGEILVTQFNLHFHPGLNVDIDHANTLRSMTDGKIFVTCERIVPNDSATATKYYQNLTHPIYKRYFHVMPFKQSQKFDLVDVV